MWDLVPQPWVEPGPPVLGVQSLSRWTTRSPSAAFSKHKQRQQFTSCQQGWAAIRWPQAPVGRQVLCTCVTTAALNVSIQVTCLDTENASSADGLKAAFFAE